MLMNCGDGRLQRPSMGAWITYGLGSENQNLPGLHRDVPGRLSDRGDPELARRRSCPAPTRGPTSTPSTPSVDKLIENIRNDAMPLAEQRRQLDLVRRLNERHAAIASARPGARGANPVVRAGLSHAGRGGRRLRHQPRARVDPRPVRARHPGPAAPDHPPAARARRAVHPGLERRRPALGRPREHRRPPPPARRRVGPGRSPRSWPT